MHDTKSKQDQEKYALYRRCVNGTIYTDEVRNLFRREIQRGMWQGLEGFYGWGWHCVAEYFTHE